MKDIGFIYDRRENIYCEHCTRSTVHCVLVKMLSVSLTLL